LAALLAASGTLRASNDELGSVSGRYLEVRSCDVYTGPCFANAEMNLSGKEGILVWTVSSGSWHGTSLNGLSVLAVVRADGTLGDLQYHPRHGRAVLVVDAKATPAQQRALAEFARSRAGGLIGEVASVRALPIEADLSTCDKAGCAKVTAGNLVEISTRCLGGKDHICGNEKTFYPPLTQVQRAIPAYTEMAAFKGPGLGLTWESTCQRSAFLASF
jgi:hypothetical protein